MSDSNIEINVREYIDERIKQVCAKQEMSDRKNSQALKLSRKEMDRRLEGMNEFRAQLEKQTKDFVTRDENTLSERLMNQKIDTLSRIVYIGLGIVLVLQLILRFVIVGKI